MARKAVKNTEAMAVETVNNVETTNVDALLARIAELEQSLKHTTNKMGGRMLEVYEHLATGKHLSVPELAKLVGISDKNISSQLSYLRHGTQHGLKRDIPIAKDSRGKNFLEPQEDGKPVAFERK